MNVAAENLKIDRGEPGVQVSSLGYVAFDTPDLDRLVDYYEDVLKLTVVDRSTERAYLTADHKHHCIVLNLGKAANARTHVGFEVCDGIDFVARNLNQAGVQIELCGDPEPGIKEAVYLRDPAGTSICLYKQMDASNRIPPPALRPTKLGHVASYVRDLPPVQSFYEKMLGFRWSDTIGDFFVFLRCGVEHHTVNFIESETRTGMHHIAFGARDWAHFKEITDNLANHGYSLVWGPGRHGVGHNIFGYHTDPDGNTVEIYTEIDLIMDEDTGYFEPRPWHQLFPQGPRVWEPDPEAANMWGPVNPDMNAR